MGEPVLLDTGPLVAIFLRRDANHACCIAEFGKLRMPPITCWPVITEAVWLLRSSIPAIRSLLSMINVGEIRLSHVDEHSAEFLGEFLSKYHKLGVDLADATLAYIAERDGMETVFTLDRRDFSVIRLSGNRALSIIPA